MKLLRTLLLIITLMPLWAHSGTESTENSAGNQDNVPSIESLIAELMANIDMELMIRLQAAMVNNLDVIGPYTQEYLACLEAEGVFDSEEATNLKGLIEQAKKTGETCQVILESMIGQMQFDITQDEFEQGLSLEYRELLQL